MAVVIPTQKRNAAVATDNMTKMMAINLKRSLSTTSRQPLMTGPLVVGPSNCSNCSGQGSPWLSVDAFPGPSIAP
jgi:hypothetical protein